MTSAGGFVDALLSAPSYRGLRAILPVLDLEPARRRTAQTLCDYALSILALDAEDWTDFPHVPARLREIARAANVPQDPAAKDRGALGSLAPTFAILQEVIAVRHRQGDLAGVLLVCHIMSEYLPLLAWEPHLGHAGDPPRLVELVTRPGSLWGIDRDEPRGRECAHSPTLRGSLREAVRVGRPSKEWSREDHGRIWREYLERDHSRVSAALSTCGLLEAGRPRPLRACERKCAVWRDLPGDKEALADRLVIAGQFVELPLVALRHAAPVGHGFGVPTAKELAAAWARTWSQLTASWPGRRNPLQDADGARAGEPLPGLAAMVDAVAGRAIAPTGVFADVDALLRETLA
ncbi:hypothetical protein [Cumulibacter manganitolerans]|uniref:hypothetical protein n=1 Tax=Cumulibacter manganitolerans TaxID=1884992 RepID=UPI0012960B6B|nr:hypothetical protein [Cumulibacter manganitolerans]